MEQEVAFWSTTRLAAGIRTGDLSSREVLELLAHRVDRLDRTINSVVTTDLGRAQRQAAAADEAVARGEALGPLHEVPMTVKDSWPTAGVRTTSGAPELADFVPQVDAWPVARLRDAGAVIYAKSNLPLYAGDFQTYNAVFGSSP
jgi:amidase